MVIQRITSNINISNATLSNPDLLVETDWLSRHLNDPDVRIVDLRPKEEYVKGHIENAVYMNFMDITGDETVNRTLPPGNSADILGGLGINNDMMVIA